MPWWKLSFSSSSPSSPASKRSSSADTWHSKNKRREGESPRHQHKRCARQHRLRPLAEFEAAGSTPRSPSSPYSLPTGSSFSPVAHPLPLPLSDHANVNGLCTLAAAAACNGGCEDCPCLSPKGKVAGGAVEMEGGGGPVGFAAAVGTEVNGGWFLNAAESRPAFLNTLQSPEDFNTPPRRCNFRNHRKAIHDPNFRESITFRLNIPTKSAPPSGLSSPVLSPRRSSNVDIFSSTFNTSQGLQVWSALDAPSMNMMAEMPPQIFPEKIHVSPDLSPSYSPTIRSPKPKPKNQSGPQSPLHPKLYSDNFGAWNDNNVNLSVHPLPLPPGSAVLPQSSLSHQNAMKNEETSMMSQWQKQKLIGSGTFGNVYMATNRHTGALCAMKEVNIIPEDPKSVECLKQLEQEIRVLSKLKHPNIVQYYGSELTEDQFFIFLEYVYPGSINKYVHEHCRAMTESVVRNFTRHILNGLAYLHRTNNIHRDIKGANLLVDVNGVVKLADFGMAKHMVH